MDHWDRLGHLARKDHLVQMVLLPLLLLLQLVQKGHWDRLAQKVL